MDVYSGLANKQTTPQPTDETKPELSGKWVPFQFGELMTIPADRDGSFRLGLDSPQKFGELKLGDPLQLQFWIASIVNHSTATVTKHNLELGISTNQGEVLWRGKLSALPTTSLYTQGTSQGATDSVFSGTRKI